MLTYTEKHCSPNTTDDRFEELIEPSSPISLNEEIFRAHLGQDFVWFLKIDISNKSSFKLLYFGKYSYIQNILS